MMPQEGLAEEFRLALSVSIHMSTVKKCDTGICCY